MSDSLTPYRLSHIDALHINLSYLLTIGPISEISANKFWELAKLKISVFFSRSFWFFFQKKTHFFASFLYKSVTIYGVSKMGQNFDDYPDFQQKAGGYKIMRHAVEEK